MEVLVEGARQRAMEPYRGPCRHARMNLKTPLLGVPLMVLIACQPGGSGGPTLTPAPPTQSPAAPTPSPTAPAPSPTAATGLKELVADLNARGASAKIGSAFLAEPLGGQGMSVCVGDETLQTYEMIDHEAALATSVKIDRDDPSKVGNAIVEWSGQPRFWLRDRIIVLYLGDDAATDTLLRNLLGPPFAESREPGPGMLPMLPCQ